MEVGMRRSRICKYCPMHEQNIYASNKNLNYNKFYNKKYFLFFIICKNISIYIYFYKYIIL